MRLIKSLKDVNLEPKLFPIFFWDEWIEFESSLRCFVYIAIDEVLEGVVVFKVNKLKILDKADYIYVPLNFFGGRLCVEKEREFTVSFHSFLKRNNICDVIFPPLHYCVFNHIPARSCYYEFGILQVNLAIDEIEMLKNISSENRRQIKKAKDNNVEVCYGHGFLNDFFSTYRQTSEKKKITIEPLSYFKKLLNLLGENCLVGVCKVNGSIEAGFFDIMDENYAYSLVSGTSNNLTIKGGKKLLIFDEFNLLRKKNISNYFFGGYRLSASESDKLYNVQNFKKSLGAEIEVGYHFIKIFSPLKYAIFSFALKMMSIISRHEYSLINKTGLQIKKS